MCTEGALAMHPSSNCVLYLCTGVVVTISYSCVLEIQQRPCIRAVSWVSSNYSHCPTKSCVHHYYCPLPYQKLCPSLLQPLPYQKLCPSLLQPLSYQKLCPSLLQPLRKSHHHHHHTFLVVSNEIRSPRLYCCRFVVFNKIRVQRTILFVSLLRLMALL